MAVISVRYTNPEQTMIEVVTDDGILSMPWPCSTWHKEMITAWLDDDNDIAPYQAPVPSVSELKAKIDSTVAAVYSQWTRFEAEYRKREAAARWYLENGYFVNDDEIWVSSFSSAVGLTPAAASALIVQQADTLSTALKNLGAARMRKYELDALSGQAAVNKANEILQQVMQIAASIV